MQKRVKQVQVVIGSSFILRRRGSNNQSTIQNPTRIFENEKSQEYIEQCKYIEHCKL
jgi:hypothetical protein